MPVQILTIARNTFVESIRQPIFFVLVMVAAVFQLFNTWSTGFSLGYTDSAEVSGDDKLLLDVGLATVLVCGMLLAAFIATAVVSREIENKTVLTVVSKPVGRPSVILGKFAGVAAAILLAVVIMLICLLMGIRHGVMTTAADTVDGPVVLFSCAAVALSIGIAIWCNYFYGWYFSQTCMVILLPAMLLAYFLVLLISDKWTLQPIWTDFRPQVTTACIGVALALLVLTAVATAVSTRLGQVMTIVVCAGVLLMGLLSNYFIGRHAFLNRPVARIGAADPADPAEPDFSIPGARYTLTLASAPTVTLSPGMPAYYGPSPNGFPMSVPPFEPFTGDPTKAQETLGAGTPPAVIVSEVSGDKVIIRHIGARPLDVAGPPEAGDFLFHEPTRINPVALGLWAVIPNMHYFWLVDAVSQNRPVPPRHLGMMAIYSAAQVAAFLALGIALFQKRDVG